MYSIENFEPYVLRKHLGNAVVLVWSKAGGYQFMSVLDRFKAVAENVEFKIAGIKQ